MVNGGLLGTGGGLMPTSVPQDSGRNERLRKMVAENPSLIILNHSEPSETQGGGLEGEQADASSAGASSAESGSVDEQTRKAQDFDRVQGRLPLGQKPGSQGAPQQTRTDDAGRPMTDGAGRPQRSDADMQARVEAYQQDFDRTIDEKIATIDEEVADIDRRLEGDRFGKSRAVTRPAAEARKEELLQERANLEKLANSSDGDRQAKFEAYQRQFDQAVNDKIADTDEKIADIDRRLEGLPTGMGNHGLRAKLETDKAALEEHKADLQKVADDPDAALKTLKAEQARANGELTGSDMAHYTLEALGLTPFGDLADVASAILYAAEGEPGEASLAMLGAIPGPIGNAATAGKWANRIPDGVGRGGRGADDANSAAKGPDAPSGTADAANAGDVQFKTRGKGKHAVEYRVTNETPPDAEVRWGDTMRENRSVDDSIAARKADKRAELQAEGEAAEMLQKNGVEIEGMGRVETKPGQPGEDLGEIDIETKTHIIDVKTGKIRPGEMENYVTEAQLHRGKQPVIYATGKNVKEADIVRAEAMGIKVARTEQQLLAILHGE